jgi:hypothetical protein
VLAKTRAGHLHELENFHGFAMHMVPSLCPQCQAKGGGAFAFAIAGIDDDDAAAFALWLVVGLGGGWRFDVHGMFTVKGAQDGVGEGLKSGLSRTVSPMMSNPGCGP